MVEYNGATTRDYSQDSPYNSRRAMDSAYAALKDTAQLADQAVDIARVMQVFNRPASGISVSREGSDYWLWHGLGGGLYSRFQLKNYTDNAGNLPLRQLAGLDTVRAMVEVDDTVASITGTWTTGTNALSVGGSYRYSTTAADTMTWTSPANSVSVGVSVVEITNGGMLFAVEVNASKTAADRLFTAQEVVDKGWYANTILVANGGTLSPTDRVMDTYSPTTLQNNYAARRALAADLTPGAHVVKLTNTGYMRIGLSTQRAYVTGFLSSLTGTTLATAGAQVVTDTVLNAVASAWEYAYYGTPAGASAPGEMGNIHGWEVEVSLTISIDGVVSTVTDLTRVDAVREITITRLTQLRHVELGTASVCDVNTTYVLDRSGLRVDVTPSWNIDFTPVWMWLMFPVNGPTTNATGMRFNRAGLLNYPGGSLTFTGLNGDLYAGRSKSVATWKWNSTGKFAVLAAIPDHTGFLNRWKDSSPAFAQVNDRSGNILKSYFARTAVSGEVIRAGSTTPSSIRYKVSYFPNGAEASLANL